MSEDTANNVNQNTDANAPVDIHINDINAAKNAINVAIERKAFTAEEIPHVFALYKKLDAFINYAIRLEREEAAKKQVSEQVTEVTETVGNNANEKPKKSEKTGSKKKKA